MAGRKRSEGFAFFLPVVGALLVMPPLVLLFDIKANLFGIPLIVAYLFSVWILLIFASFMLNRRLPKAELEASRSKILQENDQ